MNKLFSSVLAAALLAGTAGAAMASPMDQNCEAQLRAQIQTLEQQMSALQCGGNVQAAPPTGFQVQTGG